jgi:hypothetical protein
MQGIYKYIPETNHVPKQYNVAAILSLPFMVPISLISTLALVCFNISTFRSYVTQFTKDFRNWIPITLINKR